MNGIEEQEQLLQLFKEDAAKIKLRHAAANLRDCCTGDDKIQRFIRRIAKEIAEKNPSKSRIVTLNKRLYIAELMLINAIESKIAVSQ